MLTVSTHDNMLHLTYWQYVNNSHVTRACLYLRAMIHRSVSTREPAGSRLLMSSVMTSLEARRRHSWRTVAGAYWRVGLHTYTHVTIHSTSLHSHIRTCFFTRTHFFRPNNRVYLTLVLDILQWAQKQKQLHIIVKFRNAMQHIASAFGLLAIQWHIDSPEKKWIKFVHFPNICLSLT